VAATDLTVVFVGGYGANRATATSHFAALKTALTRSNTTVVQYSGAGLSGQGCGVPAAYGQCLRTPRQCADMAMYAAKQAGKGRWAFFEPVLRDTAGRRLQLEVDLRRALEAHEFELHYQPVVQLRGSNAPTSLEALVRWRHPERGLTGAIAFMPHAEETGLILPLGLWVLRETCRQARLWQLDPRPAVRFRCRST